MQEELEMSRTQDADQLVSVELEEEENLPISCYKECMQVIGHYLGDAEAIKKMIQLEKEDFHQLVEETGASIEQVTNRGTSRVRDGPPPAMATICMVFITLFWLANYPTLSFMSSLFHLHERGITKILKRCLIGMAAILKQEVQWPSDEEFERMKENFAYFQDMVCVVDETEIQVSRPVGGVGEAKAAVEWEETSALSQCAVHYCNIGWHHTILFRLSSRL